MSVAQGDGREKEALGPAVCGTVCGTVCGMVRLSIENRSLSRVWPLMLMSERVTSLVGRRCLLQYAGS